MNSNTHALTIDAPKDRAFAMLSDIENLPKWATVFCRELKRHPGGKYTVVTPGGEVVFRIASDEKTGVIDMYGGPDEDNMALWPARVVGLPDGRSLFLFTALQYPGVSDAEFEAQCGGLKQEFPHIRALIETTACR